MTPISDHIQIYINKLIKSIESDPIDFQANPQDSGFSVLTDRDGRVGAAA